MTQQTSLMGCARQGRRHQVGVALSVSQSCCPHLLSGGSGLGDREGDPQDGVGTQPALVLRPIQLDHQAVDLALQKD